MNNNQVPAPLNGPPVPVNVANHPVPIISDLAADSSVNKKFLECVDKFARDLRTEVESLEGSLRSEELTTAEFNTSMVLDANRILRRSYTRDRKVTKRDVLWLLAANFFTFLMGFGTNYITRPFGWPCVILSLGGASACGIVALKGGRS